jgi:AraC-like DNA-binding protein
MVVAADGQHDPVSSTVILQLDLLFRGGAIGLLMLAAVVFARSPASLPSRFGLALTLCTVVGTLAGLPHAPTAFDPLLDLSSSAAIPLFWLFARAWFDDAFRPKPIDMALAAAFLGCTLYVSLQGRGLAAPIRGLDIAVYLGGMAFAIHAQWLAWRNRQGDLVEARRQARTIFVVSIGLIILWLLGSEIVGRATGELAVSGMTAAAGLFMGTFVISALLFGLRHPEVFLSTDTAPVVGEVPAVAAPEPLDVGLGQSLAAMMTQDRAYRDPDLTIGMIAARVETPEYRVRRHINGGLGYRNVSDYLNEHRIAEVRSALADPSQKDVPILTIAMDAGFGSLVMFNRVFKDRLGETPSAFRRRHLEG